MAMKLDISFYKLLAIIAHFYSRMPYVRTCTHTHAGCLLFSRKLITIMNSKDNSKESKRHELKDIFFFLFFSLFACSS